LSEDNFPFAKHTTRRPKVYCCLCGENTVRYKEDVILEKEECVNYVNMRMTTGLSTLVQDCKKKDISLGGRGEGTLKDSSIQQLTPYYRYAKCLWLLVSSIRNMKTILYWCSAKFRLENWRAVEEAMGEEYVALDISRPRVLSIIFYRKAIVGNIPDDKMMQREILATLYHCCSTDDSPKQDFCHLGHEEPTRNWCL